MSQQGAAWSIEVDSAASSSLKASSLHTAQALQRVHFMVSATQAANCCLRIASAFSTVCHEHGISMDPTLSCHTP